MMARLSVGEFEVAQAAGPVAAEAYYQLGLKYAAGHGVIRDYVTAHKWLNLAAMHGDQRARDERGAIADEMSREEVVEAQRLAREWLKQIH